MSYSRLALIDSQTEWETNQKIREEHNRTERSVGTELQINDMTDETITGNYGVIVGLNDNINSIQVPFN